jgi:hypothetical protein
MRRYAVLATLLAVGCGHGSQAPVPQTLSQALDQFLAAVKANDLNRMGQLWGNQDGPAVEWMTPDRLRMHLTGMQIYLNHTGYRVIEGPVAPPGNDKIRTFRVELQRSDCNHVQPIDLMQTKRGSWIVFDAHVEAAGNPARGCQPGGGAGNRQ